jgi:hypothetical protein
VAVACVLTLPATGKTYAFVPAYSASDTSDVPDSLAEVTIASGTTIASTRRAKVTRSHAVSSRMANGRNSRGFVAVADAAVSPIISYTPPPAECTANASTSTLYTESNGSSYNPSGTIAVVSVNPSTAAFSFVTDFTTDATTPFSYSGGTFDISGITYDPNQGGVIISSAAGYETYSGAAPYSKIGQISGTPSENFGFNGTTDQIFSPVYELTPSNLNVADVKSGNYYAFASPASPATPYPFQGEGGDPDSGAVDSTTNIAISPDEFAQNLWIVGLGSATFSGSGSSATYTAPYNDFVISGPLVTGIADQSGAGLVSAAIDSPSHLAIMGGEYGPSGFCVMALPTSSSSLTPSDYACANFPKMPNGNAYTSPLDPHAMGTFELAGKPYGITFDGANSYLAIVDLQAMMTAPRDSSDPHAVTSASALSTIVSYVQI